MNAAFFVPENRIVIRNDLTQCDMEISDEKLRQIVQETLNELGPHADPALVRKVVREVVRQLENNNTPSRPLALVASKPGAPTPAAKPGGASSAGY